MIDATSRLRCESVGGRTSQRSFHPRLRTYRSKNARDSNSTFVRSRRRQPSGVDSVRSREGNVNPNRENDSLAGFSRHRGNSNRRKTDPVIWVVVMIYTLILDKDHTDEGSGMDFIMRTT